MLSPASLSRETTEGPPSTPHARARACRFRRVRKPEKRGVGGGGGKIVKNGRFWAKNGQKWVKIDDFGQKVFFFSRFLPSIAPRLKAPCPSGNRPPIYTVLNAAFSALNTLRVAPWWTTASPAASHGLPEHSPREFRRSQRRPQDDAIRISPETFFFLLKIFF